MQEIGREKLVIMVSHNEAFSYRYASQVIRLVEGTIESGEMPLASNTSRFKKKRRSYHRAWQSILFHSHWKKDHNKTILSLLASFIAFLTTILSIGFYLGSERVANEEPQKSLLRYTGKLSQGETVEIEDSPLSLTRVSRPDGLLLEERLPASLSFHPD